MLSLMAFVRSTAAPRPLIPVLLVSGVYFPHDRTHLSGMIRRVNDQSLCLPDRPPGR